MRFFRAFFPSLLLAALVVGCGGGKVAPDRGEVSGLVTDELGNPVRNARVYFDGNGSANDHESSSTSAGTYLLKDIPNSYRVIQAEVFRNGIRYYGQNVAYVDVNDRAKSVNIAVYRDDQLAKLHGSVYDRNNNLVEGVRVFARPKNNGVLTSSVALTDKDGNFTMSGLRAGITYNIQVNALNYNSDFEQLSLNAREDRLINFTLADGAEVNVPKPSNVTAYCYTSPATAQRDPRSRSAYEMMKRRLRPQTPATTQRNTLLGNPIETDLFWDPIDNTALLGFSIWRKTPTGNFRNVGFARDPQAVFFADTDDTVVEDLTYEYGVKSVDTLYDGLNGVSNLSDTVQVTPLGDLVLSSTLLGTTPTFRWLKLNRATRYSVYLYTEYPSIGVTEFYTNYNSPSTGTSFSYPNNDLTSGRTYYYLVVAETENKRAVSFSRVGSFVQP